MISFGRKVIDREDLAVRAGRAVGTLRNAGVFRELDAVAGGGRGAKELYDLEQACVAAANVRLRKGEAPVPVPAPADHDALGARELRALVREVLLQECEDGAVAGLTVEALDALTERELRDWVRGHELLTLEEARMSVPQERRPTKSTMESYCNGSKTALPPADAVFYGVSFWFRATIEAWNGARKPAHGIKGHGRPAGTAAAAVAVAAPETDGTVEQTVQADEPAGRPQSAAAPALDAAAGHTASDADTPGVPAQRAAAAVGAPAPGEPVDGGQRAQAGPGTPVDRHPRADGSPVPAGTVRRGDRVRRPGRAPGRGGCTGIRRTVGVRGRSTAAVAPDARPLAGPQPDARPVPAARPFGPPGTGPGR
ncbi:hypothetical protein ACFC6U_01565 [Kitasatospora purpeofusca]|uniref:hypothetical protein n=1 Tax=Kitasatospora purpeofusca TaxID=67352 RepID=UPI0035DD45A9